VNTTSADSIQSTPTKLEKEQRRLQEADGEIGRELHEMSGILVHPLVGIGPDLAGLGEEIGALRCQPAVEQIVSEPLPQADLEHLLQPGLRHDQDQ
jgi:hypothetical protein